MRYQRSTTEENEAAVEYNLDEEDEKWISSHPRFGTHLGIKNISEEGKADKEDNTSLESTSDEGDSDGDCGHLFNDVYKKKSPTLSLEHLEKMIDTLEKATGFETIITLAQAERLILNRIPLLLQTFRGSTCSGPSMKGEREKKRKKNTIPVRSVINDVYNYWVQKRSRLKKPLLRTYWPVTASNDTNPHLVFRPREKEKYKLRKKRQNDLDAYRKMKQIRIDFEKIRVLLDFVRRREQVNKCILDLQADWFEQRIYDMVDTSALPRESDRLSHEEIYKTLDIQKYFDTENNDKGKKRKRKRASMSNKDSRTSPVPLPSNTLSNNELRKAESLATSQVPPKKVVASQDVPPNFLHPLSTRESYTASWEKAVPFVPSYVNSHATPTFRFWHRPRIGRGGRVVIDRLPRPGNPNDPPQSVFTTGEGMPKITATDEPAKRLLDLLPMPLDHERLSRRIEEISAAALSDDEDNLDQNPSRTVSLGLPRSNENKKDGDEILVKLDDWLKTDEQLWGEERFALGPI